MQIRIEIVKRDENVPEADRQAIHVETHARRGDSFTVMRVDNFMEGSEATVVNIPSGGRLVINTPLTHEETVYDRDQAAAVKLSQQRNPANMAADQPTGAVVPGTVAPPVPGARPDPNRPQGMALPSAAPAPATAPPAPANAETTGRRYKPDNVVDTRAQEQQAAKAQQETSTGRPTGETPPKPGSPVGSPPEGNEGKGQKG